MPAYRTQDACVPVGAPGVTPALSSKKGGQASTLFRSKLNDSTDSLVARRAQAHNMALQRGCPAGDHRDLRAPSSL